MPRRSVLERHDPNKRPAPLAANIDRMCIVVAPVPAPEPFLIDKYTVAAALLGLEPVVVMNTMDLADDQTLEGGGALGEALAELLAEYAGIGIKCFATSTMDEGTTSFHTDEAMRSIPPDSLRPKPDSRFAGYLQLARMEGEGEIMRWSNFHYGGFAYGVASYPKPASPLAQPLQAPDW